MRKLSNDDRGLAAILVTVIVLLILTITTLGIATIARREQRQSLDRQLSAEAYYAAEAGVNDVIQALKADPSKASNSCTAHPSSYWNITSGANNTLTLPNTLGSGSNRLGGITAQSQYTCVLTDNNPSSLEYAQVSTDNGVSANFTTSAPVRTLVVGWEDFQGSTSFAGNCNGTYPFFNAGAWTSATPVLKLDVTDLSVPGGFHRNTMILNTNSFYLYPCSGSGFGSANFSPTTGSDALNNSIIPGNCSATAAPPHQPRHCNVNITFSGSPPTNLLIRIRPIYKIAKISVLGLNSSGTPLALTGGQKVIDVTAKAADVVRRIQVRYSESSPYLFALDSVNSLCKRLKVTPDTGEYDPTGVPPANPAGHPPSGIDKATTICDPGLR